MKKMLVEGKKYYCYALGVLLLTVTLISLLSFYYNLELLTIITLLLFSIFTILSILIIPLTFGKSLITICSNNIFVGNLLNYSIIKYNLLDLKELQIKKIMFKQAARSYIVLNFSDTPLDSMKLSNFYKLPNVVFIGNDKEYRVILKEIINGLPNNILVNFD